MKEKPISKGFVKKNVLALKYFPDAPSKKAATDNLTRAINRCAPLQMELTQTCYNVREKEYSPKQVEIICRYLGEP